MDCQKTSTSVLKRNVILMNKLFYQKKIPTPGTIFPIFISPTTLLAMTMTLSVQAIIVWSFNLPCVYIKGHCLYVRNCKHLKTYNSRWICVVVCIDISGKELRTQEGLGAVVTSRSLCGLMVALWLGIPESRVRLLFMVDISHFHHTHDSSDSNHNQYLTWT